MFLNQLLFYAYMCLYISISLNITCCIPVMLLSVCFQGWPFWHWTTNWCVCSALGLPCLGRTTLPDSSFTNLFFRFLLIGIVLMCQKTVDLLKTYKPQLSVTLKHSFPECINTKLHKHTHSFIISKSKRREQL